MALQRSITLLPGVENHRAGRVFGDDGAERIVRTFHARFASIKCGGTTTARQAAEYVLREGKHAEDEDGMEDDAGDVEASAGDKEAMLADARRIRQTARITRGPTGERILATQIIELPAESTKEQRQACAQAFVDDWRERGHQAIAVVHMHGHDKDRPQPHLHVLATGRPVGADGTVDRSAPLWRNRDEVKAERARTARARQRALPYRGRVPPRRLQGYRPRGGYAEMADAHRRVSQGRGRVHRGRGLGREGRSGGGRNTPPPAGPPRSPSPSGRGRRRSRRRKRAARSRPGSGRRSASGSLARKPTAASWRRISTGSRRSAPGSNTAPATRGCCCPGPGG